MRRISLRSDAKLEEALAILTADGSTRAEAVRAAVLAAARDRVRTMVEEESKALAVDAEDLAESRAVQADMAAMRARSR